VTAGSVALIRRREPRAWRVVGTLILTTYGALIALAIVMWRHGEPHYHRRGSRKRASLRWSRSRS